MNDYSFKEMVKISPPNFKNAYFFEKYNPLVSSYLVYSFYKLRISANTVSLLMTVLAVIAFPLLASQHYLSNLIGVVFLLLSYLLDWCDGSLARFYYNINSVGEEKTARGKSVGVILDVIYHMVYNISVILGFTVLLFNKTEDLRYLMIGMGTALLFLANLAIDNIISRFIQAPPKNQSSTSKSFFHLMKNKQKNAGFGPVKTYLPVLAVLLGIQHYYVPIFFFGYLVYFFTNIVRVLKISQRC